MADKQTDECYCKGMKYISLAIKILAFVGIFVGVGIIIQQNRINQNELKEYAALQIFSKIDDIAHEQYVEMIATGNPHNRTGAEEFLGIDSGYHNAKTLEEKLKRAKKINTFAEGVAIRLQQGTGRLESSGDQSRIVKFREANMLFNMLLKTVK